MPPRAVSAASSHDEPSLAFDWYCVFEARSARKASARLVPNGSSEGCWIRLPDESSACECESASVMFCRSPSSVEAIIELVIRSLIL